MTKPTTLTLKPATAGTIVRDPKTRRPLAEAGEEKPLTTYWQRRLRDGSVAEVKATKSSKASDAGK